MDGEMTETPLIPPTRIPVLKKGPRRTPTKKNSTGDLQSKVNASPSLSTDKPLPNYLKPVSHSCHDMCKYGSHHGTDSNRTPPVRPKRRVNAGIRGVVLNPERKTGKNRRLKKQEIAQPEEDPCVKEAILDEFKDIHEMEVIIPPEKVFNLSDISSPVHEKTGGDSEIEASDVPRAETSNFDSDSCYSVLIDLVQISLESTDVVPTDPVPIDSEQIFMESTDVVPTNLVPMDSVQISLESTEAVPVDPAPIDSVQNSMASIDVVPTDSVQNSMTSIDVVPTDSVQISLQSPGVVPTDLVPIDIPMYSPDEPTKITKKKNTGKQIVNHTGTGTSTALSQTNGVRLSTGKKREITKKKVERKEVDKASPKPRVVRKKDMVPKEGTRICRPRIKEIPPASSPSNDKSSSRDKTEKKIVDQKAKHPNLWKLKKVISNSSMYNNPSDNNSDNAKEKTIYMVEPKPDGPVSRSEIKRRHRNPSSAPSGSGTKPPLPPPHKMSFRRGKIVNVQTENSVPTRLKFRVAKSLNDDNKKGDKGVRKKRESGVGSSSGTTPPSGTANVVLRHREGSGNKKGDKGLFNHVIEETASKLVETRKSKVKALVGAFETVISLQEK